MYIYKCIYIAIDIYHRQLQSWQLRLWCQIVGLWMPLLNTQEGEGEGEAKLLHIDIYIANILYAIWKRTHKGFPPYPSPPHAWAVRRRAGGAMGWGGGEYFHIGYRTLDICFSVCKVSVKVD